jgi:hypothetical protein
MNVVRRMALACVLSAAVAVAWATAAGDGLFSTDVPLTLQLKAPFNDLFLHARADDEYAVAGVLSYTDEGGGGKPIGRVKVSLRGNTSKRETECPFPKLKLHFDEPPGDPAFAGLSTVKIGTHCGESDDADLTARFGRVANEHSPLRESFVYRLLGALDVPTLKARTARIAYVYTDAQRSGGPDRSQPLVRNAMIVEDNDDAKERLGADREIEESEFTTAAEQFTPEDTARLTFAEALIGNFDWCLKFTANDTYRCDARHPLWNILALEKDARTVPLIYDFDVSGMVTGGHPWFPDVFNEAFVASRSHAEVEVLAQLQRTRSLFPRDVLDAARKRFAERNDAAYQAFERAQLDPNGRREIKTYMDAFFNAMRSDEAFYRPVVVAKNTTAYTSADRAAAACPDRTEVPVGTPVSEPVDASNGMMQVVLLDALWHWAPPVKCPTIHKSAVWIDEKSIGADYPR